MSSLARPFTILLLVLALPASALATPPSAGARQADATLHLATLAGRRLLSMLGDARRSGDHARARCVDGKLSEVNAFGRRIAERRDSLREAEARGDAREVEHQLRVLRALEAQLRRVEREGRSCGVPELPGTVVTAYIPPDVPRDALSSSGDGRGGDAAGWDGVGGRRFHR